MQRLEVSGAVRLIYTSLGVKGLMITGVVSDADIYVSVTDKTHFVQYLTLIFNAHYLP